MSSLKDQPSSRNSNSAGAPLPIIPRRSSSTSRIIHSIQTPPLSKSTAAPVTITVQRASPPVPQPAASTSTADPDAASSSSSSEGGRKSVSVRPKRVRGVRIPALSIPEPNTPTPVASRSKKDPSKRVPAPAPTTAQAEKTTVSDQPFPSSPSEPLLYTPGSLRLSMECLKQRTVSESQLQDAETESIPKSAPSAHPGIIRKKSGQLVKSSLKSARAPMRGSLSVVTGTMSTKSEPTTPTGSKAVHFDAQLEHVKLFLAEQKPLAVSRDGSPTDDTSGTDSDFPSFIFGDSGPRKSRNRLVMQVENMPSRVNLGADVVLAELRLSPDATNIIGRVRVRNLAFDKWLAIRFTLDSWQTTSEVTGKYAETIDHEFDAFSFTIKLNDMLARIEGKTLLLALRYNVAGREIWDNNHGQNYMSTFTKTKLKAEQGNSSGDQDAGSDADDLRSRLEKVVQGRSKDAGPKLLSRPSQETAKPDHGAPPVLKASASLGTRYDFGLSLKQPWNPATFASPRHHMRTQSYPAVSLDSPPSSIPWPEKITTKFDLNHISPPVLKVKPQLGSPRDLDDNEFRPAPFVASDHEDGPFTPPTRNRVLRNHQRGYFDIEVLGSAGIRKTPPGTPRSRSLDNSTPLVSPRFYSFPPVDGPHAGPMLGGGLGLALTPRSAVSLETGGSEESTPSSVSPSSSSSRSTSPSSADRFVMASLGVDELEPISPKTSYHQFINKFCFYTGPNSSSSSSPDSGSAFSLASSPDEQVPTASPRLHAFNRISITPLETRDDMFIRSGSTTPTASSFEFSESRSPTPVAI